MRSLRPAVVLALLFALFTLALLTLPAHASETPGNPTGIPLRAGVWKLHGQSPGLPTDDLEPLRRIIGNAEVAAFGEPVHASGGFYEMKHRVFRYLVQEMGFRVFALENPWEATDRANQYVQTCQGSPEDAVGQLRLLWWGGEMRDLLRWMCEWNSTHPDPADRLHLFGFDTQFQARSDVRALTAFLGRIGVPADSPIVAGLNQCDGVVLTFWPSRPYPAARYQACFEGLQAVQSLFDGDPKGIERQTSETDFAWARIRLVDQLAWQEQIFYNNSEPSRAYEARDRGMAYVFQAIRALRFPKARTLLWAHDHHIARNGIDYFGATLMGTLLARELKHDYVNVALAGYEVSADFWVAFCGPLDPPPAGSVEHLLHQLGEDYLLVDLALPPAREPFLESGRVYYLADYFMVPQQQYDALIYLDVSPGMTPLFWEPGCQFDF